MVRYLTYREWLHYLAVVEQSQKEVEEDPEYLSRVDG